MIFPNKDFTDRVLKFPDDKLRNVLRDTERPLREANASYRVKKLYLHQLTLYCKVLIQRIPNDLITEYKEYAGKKLLPTVVLREDKKLLKKKGNYNVYYKCRSFKEEVQIVISVQKKIRYIY